VKLTVTYSVHGYIPKIIDTLLWLVFKCLTFKQISVIAAFKIFTFMNGVRKRELTSPVSLAGVTEGLNACPALEDFNVVLCFKLTNISRTTPIAK